MNARPLIERFMEKVERHDADCSCCSGCWLWTAHLQGGYGRFTVDRFRTSQKAHRVAYELFVEILPSSVILHHTCGETRCVNPEHLEPMRQADHARIGDAPPALNARKTQCDHGHALTPENTYISPRGWRDCRICKRAKKAEYRATHRAELAAKERARNAAKRAQKAATA